MPARCPVLTRQSWQTGRALIRPSALVDPVLLWAFATATGALLYGVPKRRRLGVSLLWASMAGLLLASLPWTSYLMFERLEAPYALVLEDPCPQADAIVVLGGGMLPAVVGDPQARIGQSGDRVWQAARLYAAGCAPKVIVSAGPAPEAPVMEPEAAATAALLKDLGVPATVTLQESGSFNTVSNAQEVARIMDAQEMEEALLVTSAWHMRRAVRAFECAGLLVTPIPAGPVARVAPDGFSAWVPSAEALFGFRIALKEWVGLAVAESCG